jgi:hypothetical protein
VSDFFGEPWPSGICDEGTQVPMPYGYSCLLCDDPIVEGDRGSFMFEGGEAGWRKRPVHRECSLRSVMGGIEHLTAPPGHPVGSCYEGSTLSYRESALAAWEWHHHGRVRGQ